MLNAGMLGAGMLSAAMLSVIMLNVAAYRLVLSSKQGKQTNRNLFILEEASAFLLAFPTFLRPLLFEQ
jgi:hypothetical protein